MRGRPVRENGTGIARPTHAVSQWKRSEDPSNGSARLKCAATRGGRRGDPPLSSTRPPPRSQGMDGDTLTRQ